MKFLPTQLAGAFEIELDVRRDERGSFARSFDRAAFEAHGLDPAVAQCNISVTDRRGTLRGLHYQAAPHQEAKLVRCARGSIHDVIVDLRPSSATYLRWHAVTLSADARNMLYIPADFAHGFLTLSDDVEVLYQMSAEWDASAGRGLRWNDPRLAIAWPSPPVVINERDASYPLLPAGDAR
jgi:dTDP-4-dehydrorhamnose 3,5-epimerase